MQPPEEKPELLNTAEVAKIFRVSRNAVASWAARGLLEHTRTPSGHLRFYRRAVEAALQREHRGREAANDEA